MSINGHRERCEFCGRYLDEVGPNHDCGEQMAEFQYYETFNSFSLPRPEVDVLRELGEALDQEPTLLPEVEVEDRPTEENCFLVGVRGKHIRKLVIGGKQTTDLPTSLKHLLYLDSLVLRHTNLVNFPNLSKQKFLVTLDLSFNNLEVIPKQIRLQKNLQVLRLEGNAISAITPRVGLLRLLQDLHLGSNILAEVPDSLGNLKRLTSLSLADNQFEECPTEVFSYPNLRHLDLSHNFLAELPRGLFRLHQLEHLNLSYNSLGAIQNLDLYLLRNLKYLSLDSIDCTEFPSDIFSLEHLQSLSYVGNNVEDSDLEVRKLSKVRELRSLNLSQNALVKPTYQLGRLVNLQSLDLSFNHITALPGKVGDLTNLRHLYLNNNSLADLPNSFEAILPNLRVLDLRNNEFTDIPLWLSPSAVKKTLNCQVRVGGNPFSRQWVEDRLPVLVEDYGKVGIALLW